MKKRNIIKILKEHSHKHPTEGIIISGRDFNKIAEKIESINKIEKETIKMPNCWSGSLRSLPIEFNKYEKNIR